MCFCNDTGTIILVIFNDTGTIILDIIRIVYCDFIFYVVKWFDNVTVPAISFQTASSARSPGSAPVSLAIFSSDKAGRAADCVAKFTYSSAMLRQKLTFVGGCLDRRSAGLSEPFL